MKFYNKPKELSLQRFFTFYIYTVLVLFIPAFIFLFDVIRNNYIVLFVTLFVIADFSLILNAYFLIKRAKYERKFISNNNIKYIDLNNDMFDIVYCDNTIKRVSENEITEVNLNIAFSKIYSNVITRALGYEGSDIRKIELNIVSGNDVYVVCDECFGTYITQYRKILKGIDLLKHFKQFKCDIVGFYKASVAEKINTYLKYGYFKYISTEYKPKAIFTSLIFVVISGLSLANMYKINSKESAMIMLYFGIAALIPAIIIVILFIIDFINKKVHE